MNRIDAGTGRSDVLNFDDDAAPVAPSSNGRYPLTAQTESFETARPMPRVALPEADPVPARLALADPEPGASTVSDPQTERFLISLCLTYSDSVLGQCDSAGITPNSFFDRNCGLLYRHALGIWREHGQVDTAKLVESLRAAKKFETVGGWVGLSDLTEQVPTTINAASLIDTVRNDSLRRSLIDLSMKAAEAARASREPAEVLKEQLVRLQSLAHAPKAAGFKPRPITGYAYPEASDPNVLLGSDDYLGRGGGMLFVSHAGAGKSSWIMDGCMTWALGQPWMGIKPNGKLRSLIVQAEDSDRYIGKISASFAHVHSLDAATAQELGENCQIVRVKGVSGNAFFNELRLLIAEIKPDLVIINPIYLYAEGDIGRSEFTQPFLLALDALNKDEKFAYILIHHTGKPTAKDKDGKRAEVEDWESAYMGFGSSYLANWPRCTALLEPVSGKTGSYMIKLGKGGLNAGVTKKVPQGAGFRDEPTTRIAIKHSQQRLPTGKPVYYWEQDTETAPNPEDHGSRGGRPVLYEFSNYKTVFPTKASNGLPFSQLQKALDENGPIKKRMLANVLKRWEDEGCIEVMRVVGQPMRYRCVF